MSDGGYRVAFQPLVGIPAVKGVAWAGRFIEGDVSALDGEAVLVGRERATILVVGDGIGNNVPLSI